MGEYDMILCGNGSMAGVMFFGNEKDVSRGLGSEISKCQDVIVFVEDVGLSFAVDDLFKDRFCHNRYQMVSSRSVGLRVRARARIK